MRAVIEEPKRLREIVEALKELVTEIHFVFSQDGLSIRQLDSSKAAMIEVAVVSEGFTEYEVNGSEEFCIGTEKLVMVMKRIDKSSPVIVSHEDEILTVLQKEPVRREFALRTWVAPEEQTKRMTVKWTVKAEVFTEVFKAMVKDMKVMTLFVEIEAGNGRLTFSGEGDVGEVSVSLQEHEGTGLFALNVDEPAKAMVSLLYLEAVAKGIVSDTMEIHLSTNKPIGVESQLGHGTLSYVLAPRVERK